MGNCKRTILIFPEFDNVHIIDDIRTKYDPAAHKVLPHITLVFPFESDVDSKVIRRCMEEGLSGFSQFEIELQGITKMDRWLFLRLRKGHDILTQMHNSLYSRELSVYKPTWDQGYMPHLTIGQFDESDKLEAAYSQIKSTDDLFRSLVTKITVEIIGPNDESIIEDEYRLP